MVKPSRSDPEENEQQLREWQQQSSSHEGSASAHSQHPQPCNRKPSRSEPDEEHLASVASPAERQLWRQQHSLHLNMEPQEPATMSWVVAGDEYPDIAGHGNNSKEKETKAGETGSFHNLSRPEMNAAHAPLQGTSNSAMNDDWSSAAPGATPPATFLSRKPSRSESNVD